MTELTKIQCALKAPKNSFNRFGGFYYRSCEDILTALKPLLLEHNCSLSISDDIVQVSDRYYVCATATLTNSFGAQIYTKAFAREPLDKKGMDDSQLTGTASSYARKYALNGLFCIDDSKDADSRTPEQREQLSRRQFGCYNYFTKRGISEQTLLDFCQVQVLEEIDEEKLSVLSAIRDSITDGSMTIEQAFSHPSAVKVHDRKQQLNRQSINLK